MKTLFTPLLVLLISLSAQIAQASPHIQHTYFKEVGKKMVEAPCEAGETFKQYTERYYAFEEQGMADPDLIESYRRASGETFATLGTESVMVFLDQSLYVLARQGSDVEWFGLVALGDNKPFACFKAMSF
ncbi:hypothetical protein [Neptuniibacter sp. QD37_11]|uniref:hypothetical protein n=1 Tax=Neptuniibacter sp. QD37_11 TaxID=3398209 RepID=UPI0039F4A8A9